MVGWHHQLNEHEFEQSLEDSEGQGSLAFMGSQRVRHDLVSEQKQQHSGDRFSFPEMSCNKLVFFFLFLVLFHLKGAPHI